MTEKLFLKIKKEKVATDRVEGTCFLESSQILNLIEQNKTKTQKMLCVLLQDKMG